MTPPDDDRAPLPAPERLNRSGRGGRTRRSGEGDVSALLQQPLKFAGSLAKAYASAAGQRTCCVRCIDVRSTA